jgi:crotonobetainyl-CoA:carnitine CoA-transferase CaiB-like acyl-CoA transferase
VSDEPSGSAAKRRPLSGIRIIDLTRVFAGPLCTQMLADMGADIIKVEPPAGDEARRLPPMTQTGESCNFVTFNRGKRSLVLNLKVEAARPVLDRLIANSDVLVHNFLPQTAAELGINNEDLRARYPALIVCSMSAFGPRGPLKDRPGYDGVVSAFSGLISAVGEPDRPPVRVGTPVVDLSTGLLAYSAILTALLGRERSGKGAHVDVSMLGAATTLMGLHAVNWMEAGIAPERYQPGHHGHVPYQIFACSDGYLMAGANSEAAWPRLCKAVDRAELITDERFETGAKRRQHRAELVPIFEAIFRSAPVEDWVARLSAADLPASPINTIDQFVKEPQVAANDYLVSLQRNDRPPLRLPGLAFTIDRDTTPAATPPPMLGEHTAEILAEVLKLPAEAIRRLREEGALGDH